MTNRFRNERHDDDDWVLPIRSFYKISELVRAANLTRFRILQFLKASGVELSAHASIQVVPLTELETKAKALWGGILSCERLRRQIREGVARNPQSDDLS
jgi:hypothetical protein